MLLVEALFAWAGFGLAGLGFQYCEESLLFPGYSDLDEVWDAC
jgi:hypothetical protein